MGQVRVAQGDVTSQHLTPTLDFLQKSGIHFSGAPLGPFRLHVFVEGAFEDGIARKDAGYLFPALRVFFVREIQDAGRGSFVGLDRLDAAIVHRKLFEVGQDAERQLGAPGVSAQLVGRVDIRFNVNRRLFGLQKELADAADAKTVVRGFGGLPDFDGVLVDHVLIGFGITLLIGDVPAQGFKQGINELAAYLSFVVSALLVSLQIVVETFDQFENFGGNSHDFS